METNSTVHEVPRPAKAYSPTAVTQPPNILVVSVTAQFRQRSEFRLNTVAETQHCFERGNSTPRGQQCSGNSTLFRKRKLNTVSKEETQHPGLNTVAFFIQQQNRRPTRAWRPARMGVIT
jgi:hypothetical protein